VFPVEETNQLLSYFNPPMDPQYIDFFDCRLASTATQISRRNRRSGLEPYFRAVPEHLQFTKLEDVPTVERKDITEPAANQPQATEVKHPSKAKL